MTDVIRTTGMTGWNQTRWIQVIEPDGSIHHETSDEEDALEVARPGDTIKRLYSRSEYRWVTDESKLYDDPTELKVEKRTLEAVIYEWRSYTAATDPIVQAKHLLDLNSAMQDLTSFHPGWDYQHDTMPWERDEDGT